MKSSVAWRSGGVAARGPTVALYHGGARSGGWRRSDTVAAVGVWREIKTKGMEIQFFIRQER